MDTAQRGTFLGFGNFRYLKISAAIVASAVAAYAYYEPVDVHSFGRTWLGYALGIVSALILLFQMAYGVAKCCPPMRMERRQQEWLSAHVYLGATLFVTATLHSGFQFGLNIYTLSYVLVLLVLVSGFYGVYAYLNYPPRLTQNMGTDTLDDMLLKIAELDELAKERAIGLPEEVDAMVLKACGETRLGGNFLQQLSGQQRDCPTALAVRRIQELSKKYINDEQPRLMRDLYSVLLHKERLVSKARNEIKLKARLGGWLYLHVPLSVGLLAALLAHIAAIFLHR